MSIWKDEKRGWVVKFKHDGKQYKREGLQTRSEALIWEAEKRKELNAPKLIEIPSISFQEVATGYLKHCKARMQLNTVRQKAFEYRSFIASATNLKIEGVSKSLIASHLERRREKKGNKAANRSLKDLKALFNWAIRNDVVDIRNPCLGLERFPEDPSTRYIPPVEDIDRVLMVADREEMDLLMVLYHTLGRIGEALRLTWEDVNFERRWIRLFTRKRRGGELEEDYLPMNDTLHEVLFHRWQKRDKESPFVFPDPSTGQKAGYKRNLMRGLCKKAEVKEFGFHAIRHHVASILNDSGKASMKQIQKLLRHRRQATTEVYLHTIEGDLREAAKILEQKGVRRGTLKLVENG